MLRRRSPHGACRSVNSVPVVGHRRRNGGSPRRRPGR